tara:strand:+ start:231 stop:560 length:330 start_codon:yes stop_codon:yes gene_type:complete
MSKAKMDYLWAPKDEKVVSGLLDHLGIQKVGGSQRYPTGVKYDAMVTIRDVLVNSDRFSSMVASGIAGLQGSRGPKSRAPSVDSVVSSLLSGKMDEAVLKAAMKKAGLI